MRVGARIRRGARPGPAPQVRERGGNESDRVGRAARRELARMQEVTVPGPRRALERPPLGWNSWICYGASVSEHEVLANAEYLAQHLAGSGWEYVVVDIQWYEPGAVSSAYRPFVPLEMDGFSRLVPSPERFPSAGNGRGFAPLAARIHDLGLKFGIHAMRGVPRQAVHADTPILGATVGARAIAQTNSICSWNTDMYGVDASAPGAQRYYDSVFELYADWGVDLVKVDDILSPYADAEIECIRRAIERCGRPIALSLSCGPTAVAHAAHLRRHADMWRITGDFWDEWDALLEMFDTCAAWAPHSGDGAWADCDMLPLGRIGIRSSEKGRGDRWTRFTAAEQRTMVTLWVIVRSPLMLGASLPDLDGDTLGLLTNVEVLEVLQHASTPREVLRRADLIAWTSRADSGGWNLAVFNTAVAPRHFVVPLEVLTDHAELEARDLWDRAELGTVGGEIELAVEPHGARLLHLRER